MSLSFRNRICIAVSPERISLLKLGRGLALKIRAKHEEAVAPAGYQQSWQATLDRLTKSLSQPEWQDGDVNVVLSNRLVRFAAISFGAQLKSHTAQEAYARHYLTQIYGTAAVQWELRIQHGKAGAPNIVSAADRALLDGLRQVCATHKLELRSVAPYLMSVFNRHRKAIKADPAWLVINEPGCSLFALMSGGEFVAVNVVSHASISELPTLLDRENLISTSPEPCKTVYLHASTGDDLSFMAQKGYELNRLEVAMRDATPPLGEGLYAMALSGVR